MRMPGLIALVSGLVAGLASFSAASAREIHGAGSTFVFPVMSKWIADYQRVSGDKVIYQPTGSGAGIIQIKSATVDFGASDMPLAPTELTKAGLVQFPLVIGAVVPVVNITGIRTGQLRFTGRLLADIYLGKITRWNDPRVAQLNPRIRLPSTAIKVVHRSDSSGTTFNWTHYLGQVSGEWRNRSGEGTTVQWPVGVGAKGNDGVAAFVAQSPNSIGYVEYAYAVAHKLAYGAVQNPAGRFVAPSGRSIQLAAATADWGHAKDFGLVMTNAPGPDSYPVAATTFILLSRSPKDRQQSVAALNFFKWALSRGRGQALQLAYVPLPPPLVARVNAYLASNIK